MPTQSQLKERLITMLRETILDGSDREIVSDESLGEEGVGLDSLALVQFLARIEQEFQVRIPVDVWSRADRLTIDDCAAVVLGTLSASAHSTPRGQQHNHILNE